MCSPAFLNVRLNVGIRMPNKSKSKRLHEMEL